MDILSKKTLTCLGQCSHCSALQGSMEKVGHGTIRHCDYKHLPHNKGSQLWILTWFFPQVFSHRKQNSLALMLAVVSCCPSKVYKLFGVDSAFTWVALFLL